MIWAAKGTHIKYLIGMGPLRLRAYGHILVHTFSCKEMKNAAILPLLSVQKQREQSSCESQVAAVRWLR